LNAAIPDVFLQAEFARQLPESAQGHYHAYLAQVVWSSGHSHSSLFLSFQHSIMLRCAHYGHPEIKKRYKKALKLQKNKTMDKTQRINRWRALGPGLVMASAAVGASHLVVST
jgi:hypothetical protein